MPTTQADAAASGVPLQLGEKNFVAMPLTDRQWGEMSRWLQARHFAIAREAVSTKIKDDLEAALEMATTDAEKNRAISALELKRDGEERRALALVSHLDARTSMRDIAGVPEGFNFWTWQLLRRAQPQLSQEEVAKMVHDSGDADNVYAAWKLLMHQEGENPPEPAKTPAE